MFPIEFIIGIALATLTGWWLISRELNKLQDPSYLRERGVIILRSEVLQSHSAPIGRYMGRPIWGSVTFMGMEYRFDRVIERAARERLSAGELFIDPGLVYVTGQKR